MTSLRESIPASLARYLPARWRSDVPVVPVVRLSGAIGVATPLRPGLMMAGLTAVLDKAFATKKARAVALLINSPGGSPAQSHLIYRRIRQLAAEKNLPVIAFVEDVGASGGYMLACAADEIICDTFSIVGSIGVVGATFGFVDLMQKLGVERRVYSAGERKVSLDPFQPEKPEDVARIKAIQKDMHAHFIALVKERRGARLTGDDETLFSGEYWTADTAMELGLVDQLGDVRSVLKGRYGEKVLLPLIEPPRGLIARLRGGGGLIALLKGETPMADEFVSAIETRALWSRFGF